TAQCPAVDVAGDALHVLGVFVAPWRCHLEQDRELSWHHQVAGRGGCEHEPPAPSPLLERELLRQCAAPRQTENVHLRVTQLVEQLRAQPCQRRRTVWQPGRRRAADTGHVEDDRFGSIERVEKRLDQLDIGADSVEEKERRARLVPAPNADAKRLPFDLVQADLHLSLPYIAATRRPERRALLPAPT